MLKYAMRKIFGTETDRYLKRVRPVVDRINSLEKGMKELDNEKLAAKTAEFKERYEKGETLDSMLPETFAVVREATWRTLEMRHFDVQLVGGIVLKEGKIAEMKTGEGKTLVATLPMYLNAITGKGGHLVTVNDYLAKRDAEWMGKVYKFLGLSVGTIVSNMSTSDRRKSYAADVTYGTNNEFGFDYLRDNMKYDLKNYVQRDLNFAIVDEVDSILIDEARTPLIISGPSEDSTDLYRQVNNIMPALKDEQHFERDEKSKNVLLTQEGIKKVENLLGIENLYAPENMSLVHHVQQALKATQMFHRDVDYVVKEVDGKNKVIIVDEFTGRLMDGRRYSDGLHQALEAKENVTVEKENQTLASITFQNYFRMYDTLSGMTGTADTEATEFAEIYGLKVVVVPTNKPLIRDDRPDQIYKTAEAKMRATVREIIEHNKKGQPVLVGTTSVEKSEEISDRLISSGVKHNVLNAKHHTREAQIVAQAGRKGSVTIATNMAGRGTDIVLGGNPEKLAMQEISETMEEYDEDNPEVIKIKKEYEKRCSKEQKEVLQAGGLHIVGTERHESRRVDNQLRGRSGRQGDPGSSRFFLSLEDDLLRIFGSDRIQNVMSRLGIEEDQPIEHKWISKSIENAQKKVEAHNFSIRKNILEYDDVMNQQRKTVYSLRKNILKGGKKNREVVLSMLEETVSNMINTYIPEKTPPSEWDFKSIERFAGDLTGLEGDELPEKLSFLKDEEILSKKSSDAENVLAEKFYVWLEERYVEKMSQYDEEMSSELERHIVLETLDSYWRRHLLNMDRLREGIGLRGYGQKDPKLEYKKEGFREFTEMMSNVYFDSVRNLFAVKVVTEQSLEKMEEKERKREKEGERVSRNKEEKVKEPKKREKPKIGRNDSCPCGSGRKFKKCCMGKGVYD
ncbi:MAG: preprotein translocase subunit SecA [bacterium]